MLSKSKKGFTIIEVVIVLVIAAIIMLMVFLVVPALQRSQRDSRRQNDARRLLAAAEQFASNNDGTLPDELGDIIPAYINEAFEDPTTGEQYDVTFSIGNADAAGDMFFGSQATCTGPTMGDGNGTAVSVFQENGGRVCIN